MCILEDMQPLYYFNVKTNKNRDELGQEERQYEQKRPVRSNVKEANTPFFLGSPVNNNGTSASDNGLRESTQQKKKAVIKFDHLRYDSFGGSEHSQVDSILNFD